MQAITIDFNNKEYKTHRIERVVLSNEKKRFMFGLISREINIDYHSIAVTNLSIPQELKVLMPEKLISLQCLQNGLETKDDSFQNLNIKSNEFFIDVLFDESQIQDCISTDTIFRDAISFTLEFKPEKGAETKYHNIALEITCLRAESEADYQLVIDEDYINGKEYRGQTEIEIGYIEVFCKANYEFSNSLEKCEVGIRFNLPESKNAVTLSDNITIDSPAEFDFINSILRIRNLAPKQSAKIPIYVDFSRFENPADPISVTGILTVEYTRNGNIQARSQDFYIKILPDTKTAALYTLFGTNDIDFRGLNSTEILPEKYIWQGKNTTGKTTCFYVQLGNIAESGEGGIRISDFQIDFYLHKDSSSPILADNEDMLSSDLRENKLNPFFLVNGSTVNDLPRSLFLRNEIGGSVNFAISFRHDMIGAIPKDIATVVCKIAFKYHTINGNKKFDDADIAFMPFKSAVEFRLEKYTGDYWLALDFGTSATVAAFTNGANITKNKEDDLLVNLQASLSRYIPDYDNVEVNEKNTPFLSSEILLRPSNGKQKTLIESTSYQDDIIQISPSADISSKNLHYKIPFLKSLIGLKTIPVFYKKLEEYQYHIRDNGERLIFKDRPIEVASVLANTYRSLIRDFINPQIGDHEQLNKLIITVPNTFTPMHLELIRSIILNKFPKFRRDYVDFISESDAVACNYLLNWSDYNFEREKTVIGQKTEYILVYDIGAGTTDLTYFKITPKVNGKKEVEIIGRLGKSTAGNYLDFIIAKIIDLEFNPEDKKFNFTEPNQDQKVVANELKLFIRNHIKPKLADNQDLRIYIEPQSGRVSKDNIPGSIEFDCSIILEHDLMKRYFQRNSEELISEFFNLFQKIPGETAMLKKGQIPIDTVIFTGRTIQFNGLREEVISSIKNWSSREAYFTPIRAAEELKNVVVKGALQFALRFRDQRFSPVHIKNRNLLARYGILYTDPISFQPIFKELLNPSTKPVRAEPVFVDGLTIYEYDTNEYNALGDEKPFIDMSATPTGFFVQSFSSDTAKDASEQNWEYITIMFEFDRGQIATPSNIQKVRVRIVINARNEMKVVIGNFDDGLDAPLRMEIKENETFKQSMWPYL